MKSYADLQQSKKLAEILPLESADMCYIQDLLAGCKYGEYKPYIGDLIPAYGQGKIRCWSLAALLNIIEMTALFKTPQGWVCKTYIGQKVINSNNYYDEALDACYEMILKLNKLNLL